MPASPAQPTYDVQLVQCAGLAPEDRAGAQARFRAALEFALGGAEQVLLALQAYRLTLALLEDSEDEEPEDEDEPEAQLLITLWEKAESDAIAAAIKPLSKAAREQIAQGRFEIIPG